MVEQCAGAGECARIIQFCAGRQGLKRVTSDQLALCCSATAWRIPLNESDADCDLALPLRTRHCISMNRAMCPCRLKTGVEYRNWGLHLASNAFYVRNVGLNLALTGRSHFTAKIVPATSDGSSLQKSVAVHRPEMSHLFPLAIWLHRSGSSLPPAYPSLCIRTLAIRKGFGAVTISISGATVGT